ncbi:hypothetical protein [Streptomyces sp. B93]|uniref:hypothetical protein n=1 Tax=Streptomyces sp. B93 TaxID=2824875 RepID=UPI001B397595|nr:hypothetical protein [Streptomyces sp. B93]MBQ1090078.1 hypothetical protein [Streptomyces sp. B93]
MGGVRAVERLRPVVGEPNMADVKITVTLSMYYDFEELRRLTPSQPQIDARNRMLEDLVLWTGGPRVCATRRQLTYEVLHDQSLTEVS